MVGEDDAIAEQARLYGAPVGDSVRRVAGVLGLSQAAVARTLGVSAPMLSQVVNGHRVKFGNPLAVQRLRSLLELADDVERGLSFEEVAVRIEGVAREDSTTLTARREVGDRADVAAGFSALLRAVASGRQLRAAADAVEADAPDLAEVLRVYGLGAAEDAREHLAQIEHLL